VNTGQAAPGHEPGEAAGGRPQAAGDPDAACEAAAAGAAAAGAGAVPTTCRAREVLQRVGDKWSVLAIDLLGQGTMRFTELHRAIDGITARMLTVTLRGLERDGIVTRTIHQLVSWTDSHLPEIEAARAAYDARHPAE
jgi:DNA-binding HxlR family transcriptional regulator